MTNLRARVQPPRPILGRVPSPWSRLPGVVATALLTGFVCFWTFWSLTELYYEGWNMPWPQPLAYLVPCAVALALGAATIAWPRRMGAVIVALSLAFYGWAIAINLQRWGFTWGMLLGWLAMTSLTVLGGALFVIDGRRAPDPRAPWWRRRARWLAVVGAPLAVATSISSAELPRILGRLDDGDRGARRIDGDGVQLVWAPAGPGWNWQQPWGGYPSWDSLATYGAPPIGLKPRPPRARADDMARTGLCAHLDAAGTALLPAPQHLWRMPTADEFVRSLTRRGASAGCTWDGAVGRAPCRTQPDKETPLWAPDAPPIYMWTSEQSDTDAWYVNYQGFVAHQSKGFGNPRHGYRCVRDPSP